MEEYKYKKAPPVITGTLEFRERVEYIDISELLPWEDYEGTVLFYKRRFPNLDEEFYLALEASHKGCELTKSAETEGVLISECRKLVDDRHQKYEEFGKKLPQIMNIEDILYEWEDTGLPELEICDNQKQQHQE